MPAALLKTLFDVWALLPEIGVGGVSSWAGEDCGGWGVVQVEMEAQSLPCGSRGRWNWCVR